MKKQLLTKMLLMAAALFVGTSASWAQTVTTYDFEDGNALFTADSRITATVVSGTQTIYNENFDLDGKAVKFTGAGNAQNGYSFAHYNFSSLCDKAAKVKVEFETVLGNGARSIISIGDASVRGTTGNSSKGTYSNKGAIFRIGTDKSNSYVNGANVGGTTVVSQKWLKVTVEVDEVKKTYTYSVVDKGTSTELYNNGENPISFYSSDATNCTQIDIFGYINNSYMGLIDNLIITVTKDDREQANYTVNFLDESSNPIKEAVIRSGAVGDGITLLPADKEPLWNNGKTQKYFYKSDNSEGAKIAANGSTVVNVIYRDAIVYDYTVTDNLGNSLASGTQFEGEDVAFYVPYFAFKAGRFYKTPKLSSGTLSYGQGTLSGISADANITVTYTEEENTNVVFYSEAESLTGITIYEDGFTNVRMSNGKAGYYETETAFTNLPAGTYTLTAATRAGETTFYAGGTDVMTLSSTGSVTTMTSDPFVLTGATDISTSVGGISAYFDYVIIRCTSIPVTIAATGSSFASAFAIDCANLPANVTAYKVSAVADSKATLTEVTEAVAPGTGLILMATAAGSYDIPVAATGNDISATNKLVGVTADKAITADAAYGLKNGKFVKLNAGTIPAGKAYLPAAVSAPELDIVFDGNTTGISATLVNSEKVNSDVYDLQGRKVMNPTKGLYIVNGKKFAVK